MKRNRNPVLQVQFSISPAPTVCRAGRRQKGGRPKNGRLTAPNGIGENSPARKLA